MPLEKGGRADKFGNEYEKLFTVKLLLKLIEEEVASVTVEPVGDEEDGIDLWVKNKDGSRECYQCKMRNGSKEFWSMGDLAAKNIFSKAQKQLDANETVSYYFVSPLTNTMLKDITSRARNSNGDPDNFYNNQIASKKGVNGIEIQNCFFEFCNYMCLDKEKKEDRAAAYGYLKRIQLIQFSDDSESKKERIKDIGYFFTGDANSTYTVLSNFPLEGDLLGREITENMVVGYLEKNPSVKLRKLNRDGKLLPRIKVLNKEFSETFSPIAGELMRRTEATEVYERIKEGTSVIIHGRAGCGKSGVVFELANMLENDNVTYLALKLDIRTPSISAEHYGKEVDLPASPVLCLDAISSGNNAVLILDQLDAIRWTVTHAGKALAVCKEMIDELRNVNRRRQRKIALVFVCRTFDYKNDRGISDLLKNETDKTGEIRWKEVEVGEFTDLTVEDIVGDGYKTMPLKLKELLRTPSNLYIWTRVENKNSLSATKSTSDFVSAWWEELRENYSQQHDVKEIDEIKERITNLIDQNGRLFVLKALLNSLSPAGRKYLLSNGLLVESGATIGFFHQSFYDFFSMEKMLIRLYDGGSILDVLGTKENQTPLKRYHFQMLLENVVESDPSRFVELGRDLLGDADIRFIMKHVYLAVMGQIQQTNQQVYSFAITLYGNSYWKPHILSTVFFGNKNFVIELIKRGYMGEWLSSQSECDTALGLLQSVNTKIPDEVTDALADSVFKNEKMDEKIYNILCWDAADDSDSMFQLRFEMLERSDIFVQKYFDWDSLAKQNPQRAIRLLKLLVFNKDKITHLENHSINQESLGKLKIAAKEDATKLFQDFMPVLLEKTQGIDHRYNEAFNFWETSYYNHSVLGRTFIELIKAAATALITENVNELLKFCESYWDCDSIVVNEVLLFIMGELPVQYSDFVVSWLFTKPQKRFFEYTSENDEHLAMARLAIEKHSKTCSDAFFGKLENAICSFHEKDEVERARWRFQDNQQNRRDGKKTMYFYPYWGGVQNYLLPSLDKNRTSKNTKNLIRVLGNRFANSQPPHTRQKTTGGIVRATIDEVAENISDKQWLRIIKNKKIPQNDFGKQSSTGAFFESSTREFARCLERVGDKNPGRVAKLALKFDKDTDSYYISAVFRVIGKTKPNENIANWEMVDKDTAEQLFLKFGKQSDVAVAFSRALESRPSEKWSNEVLMILAKIAETHSDPKKGEMNVVSYDEKENKTIESLATNSMNCARGCAARAIAALIWADNSRYTVMKEAIRAVVFDEHLAVNMAAMECILAVYNCDEDGAMKWFFHLVKKDIRLAAYPRVQLIYYEIHENYGEFVKESVLKMFNSTYEDVCETGSRYMANLYLLYGDFEDIIFSERQKMSTQVKGILYISVELLNHQEYYEKAKTVIEYYLKQVDEKTGFMLHRILECDMIDVEKDADFIVNVVSSRQDSLMIRRFLDFIEKEGTFSIRFSNIVFAVCQNLIEQKMKNQLPGFWGVAEPLSKLIASLYDQTKDNPRLKEINQQCLDIWDLMFEHQIGTIRELSESIMEQ